MSKLRLQEFEAEVCNIAIRNKLEYRKLTAEEVTHIPVKYQYNNLEPLYLIHPGKQHPDDILITCHLLGDRDLLVVGEKVVHEGLWYILVGARVNPDKQHSTRQDYT